MTEKRHTGEVVTASDQQGFLVAGIDTGGTFTDAVLVDANGQVVAWAKEATTHGRLEVGIRRALEELLQRSGTPPTRIRKVALSTTLATNAVVEGRNSPVGLILIGFPEHVDLPAAATKYVRGGHTLTGDEQEPLDVEGLTDAVQDLKGRVDAYAVCALMSVVNPSHELVAARAVQILDPAPVFCSHEVSGQFGIKERAATTLLNSSLVPVMESFLTGVQHAMEQIGLAAELLVVRGDGRLVHRDVAAAAPASTVCSGPAASALFGAAAVADTGVVVDVGGTTTDTALVALGQPLVAEHGSRIGGWHTHVLAVESATIGVGGDSQVVVSEGAVSLGHQRVLPVALAARRSDVPSRLATSTCRRGFLLLPEAPPEAVRADAVLDLLQRRGGATFDELRLEMRADSVALEAHLRELKRFRLAVEVGFTLTDAWHARGLVELGDPQASREVGRALAHAWGGTLDDLCDSVSMSAARAIESAILTFLMRRELDLDLSTFLARRRRNQLVEVILRLKAPLVGVGAAARLLLPAVASALEVEAIFPPHLEVGNALGAARLALAGTDVP